MAWLCLQLSVSVANVQFQVGVKGSYEWTGALSDSDYKSAAVTVMGAAVVHLAPVSLRLLVQGEFKISSSDAGSHNEMLRLALAALVRSKLKRKAALERHVDAALARLGDADRGYSVEEANDGQLDPRFTASMKRRLLVLKKSLSLSFEHRSSVLLSRFGSSQSQQAEVEELLDAEAAERKHWWSGAGQVEKQLQDWWIPLNPREMEGDFSAESQVFDTGMGAPVVLPTPRKLAPTGGLLIRKIGETLVRTRKAEVLELQQEVANLVAHTFFSSASGIDLKTFQCDGLAEQSDVALEDCPPGQDDCYAGEFVDDADEWFRVLRSHRTAIAHAKTTCVLAEGLRGLPRRGVNPQDIDELEEWWAELGAHVPSAVLMVLPDVFFSFRDMVEAANSAMSGWKDETRLDAAAESLRKLIAVQREQMEGIKVFVKQFLADERGVQQNIETLVQAVDQIGSRKLIREFMQRSIDAAYEANEPRGKRFRLQWQFTGQLTFLTKVFDSSWSAWTVCTGAPVGWDDSHMQVGWLPSVAGSVTVQCPVDTACQASSESEGRTSSNTFYMTLYLSWPGIDQAAVYRFMRIVSSDSERSSVHNFQIKLGSFSGDTQATTVVLATLANVLAAPVLEAVSGLGSLLGQNSSLPSEPADGKAWAGKLVRAFHPGAIAAAAFAGSTAFSAGVGSGGSYVGVDLTITVPGGKKSAPKVSAVLWLASVVSVGSNSLGQLTALATGLGWGALANVANSMSIDLSGIALSRVCP